MALAPSATADQLTVGGDAIAKKLNELTGYSFKVIIPNSYSYLLVIGLTPVLFLFYTGIENLIADIGISSYTLSFSLLSILLLYILKQRSNNRFSSSPSFSITIPKKQYTKMSITCSVSVRVCSSNSSSLSRQVDSEPGL